MMLEHLLDVWPKVLQQLRDARRILLLSDYDGTLTPIVERPELAELAATTSWLLQALSQQRDLTLGIISGRALNELKARVGVKGIIYAGNHGLEIEGPGINFVNPLAEEITPILRIMHYMLDRSLETIKGVFVENKGLTLSVHYRLAEDHQDKEVANIVQQVVSSAQISEKVKVTTGKKVYEVRPTVTWDKGKAIKLLMKRYGKVSGTPGLFPIYLGDDLTDEDGFRAIEAYAKGLSVFIGDKENESAAHYFLNSPEEVTLFLGLLFEQVRRGFRERFWI